VPNACVPLNFRVTYSCHILDKILFEPLLRAGISLLSVSGREHRLPLQSIGHNCLIPEPLVWPGTGC
jgi:hypothetical protein